MTDVAESDLAESLAVRFLAARVKQLEAAIRGMGFAPPAVDWSVFEAPAGSVSLADAAAELRARDESVPQA